MSLTEDILDAARANSPRPESWLQRLSPEHRRAVEEARDAWKRGGSGLSATSLSKAIVEKMTALGYLMPQYKQVQRWLTT